MSDQQNHTPSIDEITRRECGCRCGCDDCEYAADFFTPQGTPTAEFGQDEDLSADPAFSVIPTDRGYNRAAVEERAARMFEAGVDQDFRDSQAEYSAASAQMHKCTDSEFADDKVHLTGDMAVNYGPVTDDTPYHSTADYTMIDPDDDSFSTQGS